MWPRLTSTAPVAGFNVNTAPRPLLMLIPSLNSDMVDQIMAVRRTTPIAGSLAWQALTGIPPEAPPARTFDFPSNTVVLTLSAEHWPLHAGSRCAKHRAWRTGHGSSIMIWRRRARRATARKKPPTTSRFLSFFRPRPSGECGDPDKNVPFGANTGDDNCISAA